VRKGPRRKFRAGLWNSWLPECNSMRTRTGWVEPEVWFRVVHLAQDDLNCAPMAAYREQLVEIALGDQGGA